MELITEINGKEVPKRLKKGQSPGCGRKIQKAKVDKTCGFHIKVYVDPKKNMDDFRFYIKSGQEKKLIKKLNRQELEAIIDRSTISHNIEQYYIDREKIVVAGWAFQMQRGKIKNPGI